MRTRSQLHPRRRFIRTTGGAIIAAALPLSGCEAFSGVPESATAAWQPVSETSDPRLAALAYAILAPNPHNRQPWLVDLSSADEVIIRIDSSRLLPQTDPFSRQILIGTGSMVGLLELAYAALGYDTKTVLFEESEFGASIDQRIVARVRLSKLGTSAETSDKSLFSQITKRRTVRGPYDPSRLPPPEFSNFLMTHSAPGLIMGLVSSDNDNFEKISTLAKQAWQIELTTPRTMMESINLLRVGGKEIDQYRDGITINDPSLILLDKLGLFDRTQPPAPGSKALNTQIENFNEAIDRTPSYFWLKSQTNTRRDQINTGRAYVTAHLHATELGMVMHPLSQALQEYPEMKSHFSAIQQLLGNKNETVQMLCRVGYLPTGQVVPGPSPRRGLQAHLQI
ncbi:MAG: twin-arginine translocation pathway signal protein [Burkholderiaceae bacterium]